MTAKEYLLIWLEQEGENVKATPFSIAMSSFAEAYHKKKMEEGIKGKLFSADFEESTMEFEIEHEFTARAGNYTILRDD